MIKIISFSLLRNQTHPKIELSLNSFRQIQSLTRTIHRTPTSTQKKLLGTQIEFYQHDETNPRSQLQQIIKSRRRNRGLESIKEQGMPILDSITSKILSKTKSRLLIQDEDIGPSIHQLREAKRLKSLVEDAVEKYTSKNGATFCVNNEPINIIDVEISPDLKHARVFWSLPYSFLMKDSLSSQLQKQVTERMQSILNEKGGVL